MEIWLLLVDCSFQAIGGRFIVDVDTSARIFQLKREVGVLRPRALLRADTDPADLMVWRMKGESIVNETTSERMEEILRSIKVNTIEKLLDGTAVTALSLSDGQTLLVQLPGTSRVSSAVGFVLNGTACRGVATRQTQG